MMLKILQGFALTILTMSAAFSQAPGTLPDDVVELREMANRAHAEGDKEVFRSIVARLHKLRPNNSDYMYQLALAHAALGELTPAFNMMLTMQRQGLSYDFDQSPDSMKLRDKEVYGYLNDLMKRAGEPIGEATVVATLDGDVGLVEAIGWDPERQAFLVGTVNDGRVLAVSEDGAFVELLRADNENGLWGIHGLAIDPVRNRLWLTSAATPAFSGFDATDRGRSAVFELELDSLKILRRYPVPVDGLPHQLGQISLAPSGDLFFTDRRLPIVYQLKAGEDRLHPLFAARELVSLRGIAAAGDSSRLYVADYEMGIIVLNLESGEVSALARPETLNLGGIDGLHYADGYLVIIQNGIRPQRIMRLELDDSGNAVQNVAPVAVALDVFDYPNFGTLVGQDLVFLANSAGRGGKDADTPIRIARTSVEGPQNLVAPDMQQFIEEMSRGLKEPPDLAEPASDSPAPPAETPSEETPSEETPSEETPFEETPSEETPSEETPSEEDGGGGVA